METVRIKQACVCVCNITKEDVEDLEGVIEDRAEEQRQIRTPLSLKMPSLELVGL